MPYFCESWGNEEEFKGYQDYTEYGTERIMFNGNGDVDDYGDRDSNDSESGDWHDLECSRCNASVHDYEEEEIAQIKKDNGWNLSDEQIELLQETNVDKGIDWQERIKNATRGKKNVRI